MILLRLSLRRCSGLAVLSGLLLLSGCAAVDTVQGWIGKPDANAPVKVQDFAESAKFEVRWHAELGESGASLLQPALTAEAIYGASGDGALTRIERSTGKQLWRIESGIKVSGGVGAGEGLVLIGSGKGDVLAYDEEGKQRWKSKVSSEVLSVPRVADGVVIVRSGDGRIAGLDAADGKRLWLYERSTPALVVRSHAGVTIQRGVAFAGFAGGKLAALKVKDGSVLWETSVSQPRGNTELERISDITSDPVADDEQVCAIAFQGRVACYDAAQGSPLWNRDIGSDKGMTLLRKYLYLSDASGAVMALDKSSGSTLWKNEQLFMRDTAAPQALGDYIVTGDYEGYLHGLSREDGRFTARIRLDGAVQSAPQSMDDGLLVQTRDGDLYSLSIK
ncbi:MAG: outer membrane protein assembly factor BamB [Gallionellales bacterium GWA2_59_43]|nr:MAG: outer membrane protein assembly factor BamB [Gallionellales bacterium GWA2_59_43]